MVRITRIERTRSYSKAMKDMGLREEEMRAFELELCEAPERHPVIKGVGARKARIGLPGRGKSGGGRVVYYVHVGAAIYMLLAYPKSEKEDLTPADRRAVLAVIGMLKGEG
ncbi:type II toxin-antitoxin system RelE/ParE family toxin [Xanthobacteraceae bacterium A53D]